MISVVIPTLITTNEHREMTLRCLEAAKTKTKVPFETVIVETGTNELSGYSDIHIWERYKTTSGKSINRGFRCATGSFVVLLTNDVIVDDNWLEHLIEPFEKFEDCGISTLACDQLKHEKKDEIKEGIWFGLAMLPKEEAWFDELYESSWDDTDLIMRVYLKGRKMYRSYRSVVHHKGQATLSLDSQLNEKYLKNREYFIRKHIQFKESRPFQILVGGVIL